MLESIFLEKVSYHRVKAMEINMHFDFMILINSFSQNVDEQKS